MNKKSVDNDPSLIPATKEDVLKARGGITSDPSLIPADELDWKSYTDSALGAVKAVVEKGGGSPRDFSEIAAENEGLTDTVLDTGFGAAQGLSYNFIDEIVGGGKALMEKGGGSPRPIEDLYVEGRDDVRDAWAEARARTPFGTSVGEVGGAMISPANKVLSAGRGLRGVLRGAAEGGAMSYGATERKDASGQIVDTTMGAGLGALTGGSSNFITKRFNKSPNAMRAEVLGTKSKDYRVDGPGDRKQIIDRINATGMFKNRKMEYDVNSMSFVPTKKSKFKVDELERNTEERLLMRAQDATEKLQVQKEAKFGMLLDNRFVSGADLDQMALEIADEYSKRGLIKGPMARNEAVAKIQENIYDQIMNLGDDPARIRLRTLDQIKRMAQEDVRNFSKGLGELGDNDELARITARKLKNMVETRIGMPEFKKINSAQHDFLTVQTDITGKLRGLELAPPAHMHFEKTNALEGAVKDFFGGSQGKLDAAAWKESYQKFIPEPVRAVSPYAAQEVPGTILRQDIQGQEHRNGRYPQSVQNIPEQLIRTPLPRNTEALMEKKSFVLAKVAQMAPEMFEAVKDTYEHEPERLGEFAQVLSMKAPHLFERDKYNRYDGRILDEKDKALAIKDTMLRKDISAIEQAKLITKLNQEGIFEG